MLFVLSRASTSVGGENPLMVYYIVSVFTPTFMYSSTCSNFTFCFIGPRFGVLERET